MRRIIPILAAALLPLLFVPPIAPQVSNNAGGQTSDTLTADYNQAMKSKDWPRAVTLAQQLVAQKATSVNLKLLGNAQLYSGSADAALATYGQALAAAEKEKPAEGQPMNEWKDGLSQIYIGKGNALLRLKRNDEAIVAYNQSADLHPIRVWLISMSAPCSTTSATRMNRRRPAASACKRIRAERMPGSSWGRISLPICL